MFYLPEPTQDNYPLILQDLVKQLDVDGVIDHVAAYHSLLVIFDPSVIPAANLTALLQRRLPQALMNARQTARQHLIRIPVCYEGDFSPDLTEVARCAGLSPAEVIKRHSEPIYTVCCLGFIPGFAFLGYVDDDIVTPRRAEPRSTVPAGSVGIAGRQTGVYPAVSPGGWQIIGRTPMTLYAPEKEIYSCFHLGDAVQFYAITASQFAAWQQQGQQQQ